MHLNRQKPVCIQIFFLWKYFSTFRILARDHWLNSETKKKLLIHIWIKNRICKLGFSSCQTPWASFWKMSCSCVNPSLFHLAFCLDLAKELTAVDVSRTKTVFFFPFLFFYQGSSSGAHWSFIQNAFLSIFCLLVRWVNARADGTIWPFKYAPLWVAV